MGTGSPAWLAVEADRRLLVADHRGPAEDVFGDGWTRAFKELFDYGDIPPEAVSAAIEINDFRVMDRIRRGIADVVSRPDVAEALKPWYGLLCKRMGFSDEYLQAFNRPNVQLVDSRGEGVERIVGEGVVANGELFELDCLIFATGFEWFTEHKVGSGFEIRGRHGLLQSEYWKDGVLSLYGIHSREFPNRFVIGNSQQPQTANFTHTLDIVTDHLAGLIRHCLDEGVETVEPSEAAQAAWVDKVVAMSESRRAANEACTPVYYNSEGHSSLRSARNSGYGADVIGFDRMLRAQREARFFEGLEMS